MQGTGVNIIETGTLVLESSVPKYVVDNFNCYNTVTHSCRSVSTWEPK